MSVSSGPRATPGVTRVSKTESDGRSRVGLARHGPPSKNERRSPCPFRVGPARLRESLESLRPRVTGGVGWGLLDTDLRARTSAVLHVRFEWAPRDSGSHSSL